MLKVGEREYGAMRAQQLITAYGLIRIVLTLSWPNSYLE